MNVSSAILLAVSLTLQSGREFDSPQPVSPNGVRADAAVPNELHQENARGTNGDGLCVLAASVTELLALGRYDDAQRLWEAGLKAEGGYWPERFDELARRIQLEGYTHYVGTDYNVAKELSRRGLPFGTTIDYSDWYGKKIAHMVTGEHADDNWVCYTDNNRTGIHTWIPAQTYQQRSLLNTGDRWILAFSPTHSPTTTLFLAVLLFVGIAWYAEHTSKKDNDDA